MNSLVDRTDMVYIKTHGNPFSRKGTPDIIGTMFGITVVLEFKLESSEPEPKQEYELERWSNAGAVALVITENEYSILETCDRIIDAVRDRFQSIAFAYNQDGI